MSGLCKPTEYNYSFNIVFFFLIVHCLRVKKKPAKITLPVDCSDSENVKTGFIHTNS